MEKKIMGWKTRGMNQDWSVSAFNSEFSFENMNLRLSTNESNTMLSWVNEKGTALMELDINMTPWSGYTKATALRGIPIGTAILKDSLVVFAHAYDTTPIYDYIYVLRLSGELKMTGKCIYRGNLDFDDDYPLETHVSYEADNIQKVYWTDGRKQPRVINIAASDEKLKLWNHVNDSTALGNVDTFFDFVPAIRLDETVSIENQISSGGLFEPGVIQYCFTYINKHGQQSNIAYISPLYYLTYPDRAVSPEGKATNVFQINISGADTSFDGIRLYSIHRTSLNAEPIVKHLEDLDVSSSGGASYTDKGMTGRVVDPTELLFVGGREISALTMESKDGTLFLGNITQKLPQTDAIQEYFMKNKQDISFRYGEGGGIPDKKISAPPGKGVYSHTNTLKYDNRRITTFKGGERYRFGFQLQKNTGEWLEPIWVGDKTNGLYPETDSNGNATLIYASASLDLSNLGLDLNEYKNIRPVLVYPSIGDRNVLCQGVLNPTVFNALDRIDNSPFAQASWYFRPYMTGNNKEVTETAVSDDSINDGTDTSPVSVKDSGDVSEMQSEVNTEQSVLDGFSNNNFVKNVYVFVGTLNDSSNINEILKNGYLKTQSYTYHFNQSFGMWEQVDYRYDKELFDGAIKLNDNTYAFVRERPWEMENLSNPTNYMQANHDDVRYYKYTDDWQTNGATREILITEDSFPVYKNMRVNDNRLYYYVAPYDSQSYSYFPFIFWSNSADDGYYVRFNAIKNSEGNTEVDSSVAKDPDNREGDVLRFKHYDSLFTSDMYSDDDSTSVDVARQVEIQGSVQNYKSVSATSKTSNQSNTQFFIDQSIVTLNSPDIEFNTDVQLYGNENLGLRIVGYIPITANASSHSIMASSSMLEAGHNISSGSDNPLYGSGETNYNVVYNNASVSAGKRLVAGYLWSDIVVESDPGKEDKITTWNNQVWTHLIYPWHRSGSLNNDFRPSDTASSLLKTKKESNMLYSAFSSYLATNTQWKKDINADIILTENSEVMNYRLPGQSGDQSGINYYANIDKVLYNEKGYIPRVSGAYSSKKLQKVYTPVSMKYKSTSHAVVSLKGENNVIPILPSANEVGKYSGTNGTIITFWNNYVQNSQTNIDVTPGYNFLWLGEIYKTNSDDNAKFGGETLEAIRNNVWQIGGAPQKIGDGKNVTLYWTEGDTYYQRYDCLKTYAFTNEDPNQLVEILSFMCETHVNIDGRYDRNRGQVKNYSMRPEIFNLLNPVYSQQDNFFTSRQIGSDGKVEHTYPNHVLYTKTKTSGADVDLWTNVTLGSVLEMDGDKGEVTSLQRFNDLLMCFQDTGISQILYNENVQVSSTVGVPIEIANSGKVRGKRYFSNTVGCSNKWSVVQSPSGIYFIDSNTKGIYRFNGQIENLSSSLGMNSWAKKNLPSSEFRWSPAGFENIVSHYDRQNQDVLFVSSDYCLAYSEKFNVFSSFYSYENTPYFCNLGDAGIWLRLPATSEGTVYRHRAGDYCRFFGSNKPYGMTLVGNQEPQRDKLFTNLEFRASVDTDGYDNDETKLFIPKLPFDTLETWNEYQHGISVLENRNGHSAMLHHDGDISSLKRRFRIWRCDIPRDNAPVDNSADSLLGISRTMRHPVDRMRNPWLYLKLMKQQEDNAVSMPRTEIHDMQMIYFV